MYLILMIHNFEGISQIPNIGIVEQLFKTFN